MDEQQPLIDLDPPLLPTDPLVLKLREAGVLLRDRSKRCKNTYARTVTGIPLSSGDDEKACQWCLVGALEKVSNSNFGSTVYRLRDLVNVVLGRGPGSCLVTLWDTASMEQQDVIAATLENYTP